jgi:flagellar FliJ protein
MHDSKIYAAKQFMRTKQFEVREKETRVALLGTMIRDFDNMIADLNGQIAAEEDRTRIKDTGHPAYSTFATAAAKRRNNLLISAAQTKSVLEEAKRELDEVAMQFRDLQSIQNSQPPPHTAASAAPEAISAG